MTENVTDRLIAEITYAPGDRAARFRRAKPAVRDRLSNAQTLALRKFENLQLGYVSKALLYDNALRYTTAAEQSALASLVKGGVLAVLRNEAGFILCATSAE